MRFLAVFLALLFSVGVMAQGPMDYDADFYIMADDDFDLDSLHEFEISGGKGTQMNYVPYSLPIQSSTKAPITLPLQSAAQQLIQLPVLRSEAAPINMAPIVHKQYMEQPITQYRYVEQPIIQPRLIEQPKLQQRVVTQPIYRQIVTQPVIVPRITTQPIIHQRLVDQPIIQHRLIENTVVQPQLVDVPVTNKAMRATPTNTEAAPIVSRSETSAQPIYRQAPTITQAPVTQRVATASKYTPPPQMQFDFPAAAPSSKNQYGF